MREIRRTPFFRLGIPLIAVVLALLIPAGLALANSESGSSTACEAGGQTLSDARAAYAESCRQPRLDCDPIDGQWLCSSQRIGDNMPRGVSSTTPEGTDATTAPTVTPSTTPSETTTTAGSTTTTEGTTTTAPTSEPDPAPPAPPDPGGSDAPTPNTENGFPAGHPGSSELLVTNKEKDTRSIPPDIATFRTDCHYSHMNFDDAIVFPGMPGLAHLHVYFGNTTVDAFTNPDTLVDTGASTCAGGRANRSAYWVPAVIDTNDGNRVLEPEGSTIYYKSGWSGGKPEQVVAPPNGLRVVAGNQTSSEPTGLKYWQRNYNWACGAKGQVEQSRFQDHIPTDCRPGELLMVRVDFPNCWDGENLDSPDHQSHMAYTTGSPQNRQDCPASHPVAIPKMSVNAYFKLTSTNTSGLRLSSDNYTGGPGGFSAHADWIVAWDQAMFRRVLDGCFQPADDCGHNNFNDGQGLENQRK